MIITKKDKLPIGIDLNKLCCESKDIREFYVEYKGNDDKLIN